MSAHVFRSRWRRLDAGPPVEGLVAVVHEVRLGDHLQAKRLVALAVDPDREPGWRGRVEEGDDPDGASIDAVETEQVRVGDAARPEGDGLANRRVLRRLDPASVQRGAVPPAV